MIHPAFRVDGGCVGAHWDLRISHREEAKRKAEKEGIKSAPKKPGKTPAW